MGNTLPKTLLMHEKGLKSFFAQNIKYVISTVKALSNDGDDECAFLCILVILQLSVHRRSG